MLLILLLRNPQLMKRPQTRQDTPSNPTPKLPFHHLPGRNHAHPNPGMRSLQFLLQAIGEPRVPTRSSGDDNVS